MYVPALNARNAAAASHAAMIADLTKMYAELKLVSDAGVPPESMDKAVGRLWAGGRMLNHADPEARDKALEQIGESREFVSARMLEGFFPEAELEEAMERILESERNRHVDERTPP